MRLLIPLLAGFLLAGCDSPASLANACFNEQLEAGLTPMKAAVECDKQCEAHFPSKEDSLRLKYSECRSALSKPIDTHGNCEQAGLQRGTEVYEQCLNAAGSAWDARH